MTRLVQIVVLSAVVLVAVTGCSTNVEREDTNAPPASATLPGGPPTGVTPAGPAGAVPAAGSPTAAEPLAAAAGSHEKRLQQVEQLEASYKQDPTEAAKTQLLAAKYDYASKLMDDQNMPPRQKYRPALKQFNEILALSPGYKDAAERKQAIEAIYRSMGMPVPR